MSQGKIEPLIYAAGIAAREYSDAALLEATQREAAERRAVVRQIMALITELQQRVDALENRRGEVKLRTEGGYPT
jgi:hypothetical protein